MNYRNILITFISLLILSFIGFNLINYFNSFREIQIDIPVNTSVKIYKKDGNDQKEVLSLNQDTVHKLQIGEYTVKFVNLPKTYVNENHDFIVDTNTKVVKIELDLTDAELSSQLNQKRSSIRSSVFNSIPGLEGSYTIKSEKLFKDGTWYGAVIKPNNPSFDERRLIMKNEDGKWILVTKEPLISIGSPSFPNVPKDLISDLNRL